MRKAKSQLISSSQMEANVLETTRLFDVEKVSLEEGFKYLGFSLTPNNYNIKDWGWLTRKFEHRLLSWSYQWLTIGGGLIMVQTVLQSIAVYWLHLYMMPKYIIRRIKSIISKFIWARTKDGYKIQQNVKIFPPTTRQGRGFYPLPLPLK